MKYPLEISGKTPAQNLLLWLQRFLRYKVTTLSNRLVKDRDAIFAGLEALQSELKSVQELESICKSIRNAGLSGLNTYAGALLKLHAFVEKKSLLRGLKEIDEEVLSDFLTIQTSALSPQTRKNYRIALLGLFAYIDKQNQDGESSHTFGITLKISAIKNSKAKLPIYLKEEEIRSFLDALPHFPMPANQRARNKLIITLILYTGIRVSEALTLRTKDITKDKEVYLLNIRGKGDKSRVVMVKAFCIEEMLSEWLALRASIPEVEDQLLFCNKNGKMLSQAYIYKNVENILKYAGIKKEKMGAHMLRHSFATLLYQRHKDLVLVQEALGHADLNTSRIYTHFDKDQLLKAASLMDELE